VKKLITTLAAAASLLVLGCTTRRAEPPRVEPPPPRGGVTLSNVPRFQQPPPGTGFTACQLGTSCLTLDERPFEICLLDTKHCRDKVVEPLLVDDESVVPPSTEPILEQR